MLPQHLNLIDLNNTAVHHLEDGDFNAANRLLTTVVVNLLKITENKVLESVSSLQFSWSEDAPIPSRPNDDEAIGAFVYARGMFVTGSRGSLEEAKAVISYNAALAAHLLGLETSESFLLTRAHYLYKLSRAFIRKQQAKGSKMSKLLYAHFFHMAILNNLGQISIELVDYESSKSCFEMLLTNLKHIMSKTKTVYGQEDLQGMLSNSIVILPTTAPAA